jgi:hypothetical protein
MFTISLSNAKLSLSIFAFAHRHATHSVVFSICLFHYVPHVLICNKFFKGSSKVGYLGYSKGFVVILHIISNMLEINVYSIIVSKVFGVTIFVNFHFAIVKRCVQLQMNGSCRKDGVSKVRWRWWKECITLFQVQIMILDLKGLID